MSAEPQSVCHIRRLEIRDLPEIMAIERAAYAYPWSEGIFRDCLRIGYHAFAGVNIAGDLMGYGLLSIAVDDAHVLNLCVGPLHRRKGVATSLLWQMIGQARWEGADTLMLEVRPTNGSAIELYDNMGFHRIGVRKRYYPAAEGREDALLLARAI